MKRYDQNKTKQNFTWIPIVILLVAFVLSLRACYLPDRVDSLEDVPPISKDPYVVIANNIPTFTEKEVVTQEYVSFSRLDALGRVGVAEACLGPESLSDSATIESSETPSGWKDVMYDGKALYERCNLISSLLSYQITGAENLFTGTSYLSTESLPYVEELVAVHILKTGNHVMYRVTPVFDGNNLIMNGLHIEAISVEDNGEGICMNVFVYNYQPDITIDYSTGDYQLNK